jgi:hypothetical protein
MLLCIFNTRETMEKFYQNKKTIEVPVVKKPLAALISELAKRRDIRTFNLEKGALRISARFRNA